MPLFMDYHKIENIKLEDVVNAHMADLAIQEKYGVRYLQYWVNEKAGMVFCLTEGPDARTCEMVHQMAHGNLACAITEVEAGTYQQIMGNTRADEHGLVRNHDGIDLGYRTVVVVALRSQILSQRPSDTQLDMAMTEVCNCIVGDHGRLIESPNADGLIAVFSEAAEAVNCSDHIRLQLLPLTIEGDIVFRVGVCAGQPVTSDGQFFTNAIRLAQRMSHVANDNQTLISSLAKKLSGGRLPASSQLKYLSENDEQFVSDLLSIAERKLSESNYTIEQLCRDLGFSRPQLYRKITALTGRAPNNFLRDLRLDKAVSLLQRRAGNISEVALEVGFTNPSYFSKCFAEKFGCIPSEIVHS